MCRSARVCIRAIFKCHSTSVVALRMIRSLLNRCAFSLPCARCDWPACAARASSQRRDPCAARDVRQLVRTQCAELVLIRRPRPVTKPRDVKICLKDEKRQAALPGRHGLHQEDATVTVCARNGMLSAAIAIAGTKCAKNKVHSKSAQHQMPAVLGARGRRSTSVRRMGPRVREHIHTNGRLAVAG